MVLILGVKVQERGLNDYVPLYSNAYFRKLDARLWDTHGVSYLIYEIHGYWVRVSRPKGKGYPILLLTISQLLYAFT